MSTSAASSADHPALLRIDGAVATITLNRPDHLNTIVPPMPDEIEAAVGVAERDPDIKVIVLRGAGRAFCAGYDFGDGFQQWSEAVTTDGHWDPGKDFAIITLDPNGAVMTWSDGAERLMGYRRDEILGQNFAKLFTVEDVAAGKPQDMTSWRLVDDRTHYLPEEIVTRASAPKQ